MPWSRYSVRARPCAEVLGGNWMKSKAVSICFLCLVPKSERVCASFSWVESRCLTALLVPLVFKLAKRTCLSSGPPQGWGAQYVVWTAYSPERISKSVYFPSMLFHSKRKVPTQLLLFVFYLTLWIFLYRLGCKCVILWVFSLFSVRIAPHVDVFSMFSGGWLSILLVCHLHLLLHILYLFSNCILHCFNHLIPGSYPWTLITLR